MSVDEANQCVQSAKDLGVDSWMVADEHGALVGVWDGRILREFDSTREFRDWRDWYLASTVSRD